MPFERAFEELLDRIRRRGFKTDTAYINYLYDDLQSYPKRANTLFYFYGVI